MRELGGHGKAGAHPEATQGTRIHPVAGRARLHRLRADGDDIAAVADVDGVLGEELVELPRHPVGVDGVGVGQEKRHQFLGLLLFDGAQVLHPAQAARGAVPEVGAGLGKDRLHDGPGMSHQPEVDVTVLPHGAVVEVDLHDRRPGGQALAVAHAEVEGGAHDHDHVGVAEAGAAGAVEVVGVVGPEQPARGAVGEGRDVQRADQIPGLLVGPAAPHLLAEEDGGALGLDEQIRQPLDVARVADGPRRGPVAARLGDGRSRERNLAVQNVARDLDVAGSGRTGEALARGHRHHVRDALGGANARRELGDGARDVHVRQILQRPHLVLGERTLPADVQHRALRPERGRDPGERVGEARARRRDHAPEPAGLARVPVRGVGGDLLVTHVDDADPLVDAPVVGVDDVPAAQREDGVDALVGQRPGRQVPARDDVFVAALARERVFGSPGFQCGRGRHEQILRDGLRIEPRGPPRESEQS